ncbi:MAG: acyl-ACP--UDP-N-acetylglucosamine O-acyltransferase [Bacteroidales bacterium]|nr:acyl-ACP--UDP-N-acetylglucosamine O-acyltransferase [Bacteroidales bacterium]MCM1148019.1 acyl-ACP--UDP-N-acetylglucosamine O-acyltransferase [Bacteroidales bacterium]MCM1206837.1 acyl-ACP--UDP-N-acetylglucosamine O-acyltransferase [Bacillota bacterium]MCM1511025.1 acyl-ACP--UDP-N-acetylglucosamine O-acyltransferase [Clostridium sp.]
MSNISQQAYIDPKAKIGNNVTIYPFAYIEGDVEIGDNCVIYPYASIMNGTRLGCGNKVFQNTVLGAEPQDFNYKGDCSCLVIGNENIFRENVVINRATFCNGETSIGNRNFFMEGVHVSHDTKVKDYCTFGYGTKVAGDCEIHSGVIFSSSVIINPNVRIGSGTMVTGGVRVSRDVPPFIVATHNPVEYGGVNEKLLKASGTPEKVIGHIANAYRLLFHGQTAVLDAINQIKQQVPDGEAVRSIIKFLETTEVGIISKM